MHADEVQQEGGAMGNDAAPEATQHLPTTAVNTSMHSDSYGGSYGARGVADRKRAARGEDRRSGRSHRKAPKRRRTRGPRGNLR